MNLRPVDPYTWTRLVRRCQLGGTVKSVAWVLADYASPDGRDVRPGVELLMADTELSKSTVMRALTRLRALGLVDRVFMGSKAGRRALADEYRLTYPDDLAERVPMRSPDGLDYPGSGVTPTPDRPSEPVDNPGSGVTEEPAPGAPTADSAKEQVSETTGTGVTRTQNRCHTDTPPTKHLPNTYQHAHDPPYGAEEERPPARAAPVDNSQDRIVGYRQPPLLLVVPTAPTAPADNGDAAAAARAHLGRLPDLGAQLMTKARTDLGDGAPLAELAIRAHQLALERPA